MNVPVPAGRREARSSAIRETPWPDLGVSIPAVTEVTAVAWGAAMVILAVGGFSYLLGLSNYGVGEESPGDEADDGH
jgi:hypothetical protein